MRRRLPWLLLLLLCISLVNTWPQWGPASESSVADLSPAGLELPAPVLRVGALRPGEERLLSVPWRRVGAGSLRILGVRTGCGCAVPEAPRGPLAPGAAGALTVRLRAGREAGPFAHRLRVFTDPPPAAALEARIVGHVSAPIALRPAALTLGRRSPAVRVERLVELRAVDPLIGALSFAWAGLTGAVVVEPPARRDLPGHLLRITVDVPRQAGPFAGRVAVRCEGELLGVVRIRGSVD